MRSSKPPAIATWLLEHLIPGGRTEELAGDLLEQFNQGRSAAWYWRQALVAVFVSCSNEMSILWTAVGFTGVWCVALSQLWSRRGWTNTVISPGMRFAWPVSQLYIVACVTAIYALPLPVALYMYLRAMKSFSLRRFSRGVFAGLLALSLGLSLGLMLSMFLPHAWTRWPSWYYGVGYVVASFPLFFALLFSMWTVRPNNDGREPSKISV